MRTLPIGLTGNIGCGKSTVASLLSQYPDVAVFDCDAIAKEIVFDAKHVETIRSILGDDVFTGDNLDPKKVAHIIFNDPEKKMSLEAFVHPLVWRAMQEWSDSQPEETICVIESAIIFETENEGRFEAVIVAACNLGEQIERLKRNRKMTLQQIDDRLSKQMLASEKEAKGQTIIHTDCSLEELKERVANLHQALKQLKGTRK